MGDTQSDYGTLTVYDDLGPAKLNIRRRFWRWLLGYSGPLYTADQVAKNAKQAIERAMISKGAHTIEGQQRFQIINAMNGKIIRFNAPLGGEGDYAISGMGRPGALSLAKEDWMGERYFVVPEGEDLLGAIARVLVLDKVKAK